MKERIVILGAGESGTGAALLAKAKGYDVFVSDQGQIKEKYKAELKQHGIAFEEGLHTEDQILNASLIIKSPGIPEKAEIIKKVKYAHISIIDEIEFAYRYIGDSKIAAITGTNGKTTTTLLTYHLMKSAGMSVALAGNVGFSMARQVAQQKFDWYVLEMSSFQLDGTETFKPDIGILLNITPDHLDRYEYNMQNYVNSKFQLIENMEPQQHFIYYADDAVIATDLKTRAVVPQEVAVSLNPASGVPVRFDGEKMTFDIAGKRFSIAQSETTLKGPHNLINTMASVSAAVLAGVEVEAIKEGLKTFKNAPHRLEPVGTIKGIEFVNDSKATNVDSVVYALGSYDKPLVWIAGGIDKGNDYNLIKEDVKKKVKVLICLGKDNEKLKKAFGGVVPEIQETQSVPELVRMALKAGREGDVVLLSPACASFDLFRNYEDRGDQFRKAVAELKKEIEGK
ncbi:UDP-N-acetylmuramoyl-L-alanine--D-glutamate ligase [Fulvivirgaceae bacterium PWU4]|uniref:UDP-N-acetylmuramoylalanine--D-glutamate ligase n=1 Tax=Chryseosolibacter histidini TaxID=2782349 RepID=A0AAP2GJC4_9BACT|nr:UDP-N-acetylmuramoyl-L-alanine--D-glutamate ligase [Chryseosolibacter histidini]MBT1698196.1 UDP-N-acetylmuramoyl-L-alanine--D-glutamate ligase [Chryseosolibacter histidini]